MSSRSGLRARRTLALVTSFMLVTAACGSDDEGTKATDAPATADTIAPTDTAGDDTTPVVTDGTDTTEAGTDGTEAPTDGTAGESEGSAGCPAIDTGLDEGGGTDAGRFVSDLTCAGDKPLKAEGDPIVIGFQNPEGDPNGSFPEFSLAAEAAVEYINSELGGLGADIQNGVPGRPIELDVCKMAISPDDSQRCANELLAADPFMVFSSFNFFGNHFPIYAAAEKPVIVITPVTVGDFTSPGVYAIGGGGGCLGVHTGLVKFATEELGGRKIGVPWADTPPGVVCYYDLESKPLDVLAGTTDGTSELAGTMPELTHLGVPIKPATPDTTAQVTEILDFDPDVIIFSAQGADCWNFVDTLGRLGWTPDSIPLVLSGSCLDFDAMAAAGDLAKGIYFVGSSGSTLNALDTIKDPLDKFEATIYQEKAPEYGLAEDQIRKGFATQGFTGLLSLWELSSQIVVGGGELTGDALADAYASTDGQHLFGSTPLSCATAPVPYVAVCNAEVSATQWDGSQLVPVLDKFSGIDLVAGTEIKTGP